MTDEPGWHEPDARDPYWLALLAVLGLALALVWAAV